MEKDEFKCGIKTNEASVKTFVAENLLQMTELSNYTFHHFTY